MTNLPLSLGDGWGTVLADPPWDFDDQAGRMRCPYPTMSDDDLRALPVGSIAAPAAHLYLWVTSAHLELGLELVRLWGFTFKSEIVWVKTKNDGTGIRIGGGHYLRKAHEICLFAARKQTGIVRNIPSVFMAPRTEHSAKPARVHEIAEKLSPGPRIELFARQPREGWSVWGNEV